MSSLNASIILIRWADSKKKRINRKPDNQPNTNRMTQGDHKNKIQC